MAKKKAVKKAARPAKPAKRGPAASKAVKKVVQKKKPVPKKAKTAPPARPERPAPKPVPKPAPPEIEIEIEAAAPKKGVRKATITSGIKDPKGVRKLGRSRIPVDAPLDVVFQNDIQAREAFVLLGVHSIRELETFKPDDLVMRLTAPAKLTVGRIRKILAMNNRCLSGDEDFAMEFLQKIGATPT
jgi:hypothetical protein